MGADRQAEALEVIRNGLAERVAQYHRDSDLASVRIDALELDSLEKLQLVLDLETALSVMANETEVAACRTVGDLVAVMLRSRAAP